MALPYSSSIDLTEDRLQALCSQAGLRLIPGSPADILSGGYRNTNVKIETTDGPCVVRFYRDPAVARKESALHLLLGESVPLAPLIHSADTPWSEDLYFAISEFVPGTLLENLLGASDEATSVDAGAVIAETLAAIHAHVFEGPGFLNESLQPLGQPTTDPEGILSYVHERLYGPGRTAFDSNTRETLWEVLEQESNLPSEVGPQTSLVHCDFNPKNIIMAQDGERVVVAAILDWEFAFSGSPIWDAANMLRFGGDYPSAFTATFAEVFEANTPSLPPQWRRMGRMMDTANLSEFLAAGAGGHLYDRARDIFLHIARQGSV